MQRWLRLHAIIAAVMLVGCVLAIRLLLPEGQRLAACVLIGFVGAKLGSLLTRR